MMSDNPPRKRLPKTLVNKVGEKLVIRQAYEVRGVRFLAVDSDDDRLLNFFIDRIENQEDFLNFCFGETHLDESEFIGLLKLFNFPINSDDIWLI
jgi:hypothetical protein